MAIIFNDKTLDELSFNEETSSFILSNKDISDTISVPYIPKKEKNEFLLDDYELLIFENKSLNAENDIFLIYENSLNKGVGWIFPMAVLESNDNKLSDKNFFNQFRYLAYEKLLSKKFDIKTEITQKKEDYLLSDIFKDEFIILVISKNEFEADNSFDINNYLPSLASSGYFIKNENILNYKCPNDIVINNFRGNKRINISQTINVVYKEEFTIKLYNNYLKTLGHQLIRFHLLYQIIEFLLTESFNKDFNILLNKYTEDDITKNNFLENIAKIRNERERIRKILTNINPNSDTFEKTILIDLKRDCKDFLSQFGVDEREELGDLLYDVRNIIVHNYRKIKDENLRLLDQITFEFEIIINYLMTNCP